MSYARRQLQAPVRLLTHDLTSDAKLPQMIVKMLVLQNAPAVPRNTPKDTARWPRRGGSAGRKARNQIPQVTKVRRHVVGRVARNSGGLCPFPFGHGKT